jgi:hypothetical protein
MSETPCACEVIPSGDEGGISCEIIHCPQCAASGLMLTAAEEVVGENSQGGFMRGGKQDPDWCLNCRKSRMLPGSSDEACDCPIGRLAIAIAAARRKP